MGCVQSQPSHPSKHHASSKSHHHPPPFNSKQRRSHEFYHQYQAPPSLPHNDKQINILSSKSVISNNEASRPRIQSNIQNRVNSLIPSIWNHDIVHKGKCIITVCLILTIEF